MTDQREANAGRMGRLLGIDLGDRRIGIAVTDENGLGAIALKTLGR
jgi:RNase H-fold protein (predicted Holliday junction resolvase)